MTPPVPTGGAPGDLEPDREALMAAVDALPDDEREVVVLRYGSRLSEAETAAVLEIPLDTVRARCRRALARLQAVLAASDLDPRSDPG